MLNWDITEFRGEKILISFCITIKLLGKQKNKSCPSSCCAIDSLKYVISESKIKQSVLLYKIAKETDVLKYHK